MGLLADIEKAFAKMRRKRISEELFKKHNGVIQLGPFKGLRLSNETNISRSILALKIYGLYEQVIIDELLAMGAFDDVVDIGAADGYFPIGMLKAGLAKRTICFEATEKGQASIKHNAAENGCADKVVVFGSADETLAAKLGEANYNPENSLIICDIEGAEFEVFSKEFFQNVHGATIIVELHDRVQGRPLSLRDDLAALLPSDYSFKFVKSKPVSWDNIQDLEELHDIDRALVTSEGRKMLGEWLIAHPK
jgi:hypothetical protein